MSEVVAHQPELFSGFQSARFPSTRYQGSKAKLVEWIWEQISDLDFETCLDAFGGTGAVAYRLKQAGKRVTYNDLLRFNYHIGLALIESSRVRLERDEVDLLLREHPGITYPSLVTAQPPWRRLQTSASNRVVSGGRRHFCCVFVKTAHKPSPGFNT